MFLWQQSSPLQLQKAASQGGQSMPPHWGCSTMLCPTHFKAGHTENRHEEVWAGVRTKHKPRVTPFLKSTKNQSKKMSLVPLVLMGQHNTRGRFYGSHLSSFLSPVQAVDSGNGEHIAWKKKICWRFCCQVGLLNPMGNVLKWQSCSPFWQWSFIKQYSSTFSIISVSQWRDKPC